MPKSSRFQLAVMSHTFRSFSDEKDASSDSLPLAKLSELDAS